MRKLMCVLLSVVLLLTTSISVAYADNGKSNGKKAGYSSQDLKKKFKQYYKDKKEREKLLKEIMKLRKEDGDDTIPVFIRGDEVKFDVPPVIKEGRVLIPVRAVTESLGADVDWDDETKTVTITKGQNVIKLKLESNIIVVNGKEYEIDSKAQSVNSRIVVPVRYIAMMLGMKVDWDDSGCVIIDDDDDDDDNTTPTPRPTQTPTTTPAPTTTVVKYEAESAVLAGGAAKENDHTGYSGSGYVNGFWNQGASVTFVVSAPAAANYNVSLRYSNFSGIDRTLSIYVNGTKIKQTVLNKTANWDTWAEKAEVLTLNQGYNTIIYKYESNDTGNVNIDYASIPVTNGSIKGSSTSLSGNVSLSTVGTLDWIHWGLNSAADINRKYGVTQQISNYTHLGSTTIAQLVDNQVAYSWTGGTPTAANSGTKSTIFKSGAGNGFQLTVPADTTSKTLKLYVGSWQAKGKVEAFLSDGSHVPYVEYIDSTSGMVNKVVTIKFNAATSGQTLTVRYFVETSHNENYGHVSLQGAALSN